MSSKLSYRSRYRSTRTKRQLGNLPDWIRKDPSSALWNLVNPPSILIDDAAAFVESTRENRIPNTYNVWERNPIYASDVQNSDPSATYSSESGNIEITVTEELEDFFFGAPTRIVGETGDARTIAGVNRIPIDVYAMSKLQIDADEVDLVESGSIFVILQENAYSDTDAFVFFNPNWKMLKTDNVEQDTQDYENQIDDEWILPESGVLLTYELQNFPLKDTVTVKNVLALDNWGNATEIPTAFTVEGRTITFDDDIAGSGMYIAEYDYVPDLTLRAFCPLNYEGITGSQGVNDTFLNSIIRLPSNNLTLNPPVSGDLNSNDTHNIASIQETVVVRPTSAEITNSVPYLKFSPDQLRPGMSAVVTYRNASGDASEQTLTAARIDADYDIYCGEAYYVAGIDVTSFVSGDYNTFHTDNFSVHRFADYSSISNSMEEHIYDRGEIVFTPYYVLDRTGQYIEERSPESGGFVKRNLFGHSYVTTNLPNLRITHPDVASVLYNTPKILNADLPSSVPIAIRRWASWLIVLRKNNTSITPNSRFFQPTNQGDTAATYDLVFVDLDTWEEYTTFSVTLGFEPTTFTIDANETIHILGYEELAKSDASTAHTISISSALEVTIPIGTIYRYDVVDFTVDIAAPDAKVRIQHVPSSTMVYNSDTSHSGEFTSQGWGTYRISGEYNSSYFSETFEIEPTDNRKVWRQPLQFRYDYAIIVPTDDEQEVVYFRERYKWGIDRATTDA